GCRVVSITYRGGQMQNSGHDEENGSDDQDIHCFAAAAPKRPLKMIPPMCFSSAMWKFGLVDFRSNYSIATHHYHVVVAGWSTKRRIRTASSIGRLLTI